MDTIFVTAVLAFLVGMAVGIAGYFFTTIAAYEREIEDIFERMCLKYENKLKRKDDEIDRLHASLVSVQSKLAERKVKK